MKWRWIAIVFVVVVGGCNTALMIAAHGDAKREFEEHAAKLNAMLTKHGVRFRDDEKALSALPLLKPRRGKDAGALLAAKIPYPSDDNRFHYAHVVPEAIAAALDATPPAKFPEKLMDVDVAGVDTRWMAQLADFDQWDMFEAEQVKSSRPLHLDTMPLPSAMEAQRFAKVRLLQGLHDKDTKSAAADVDNLVRLLATTELFAMEERAPAIMGCEKNVYEYAKAHDIDVEGWAPLDPGLIAAWVRVLSAYRAFTDLHADPAAAADLFASPDAAVGRCAAIQEAARVLLQIEPVTTEFYGGAHAMVTKALADTKDTCRLTRTREAWEHPGQTSILVGNDALCDPEDGSCVFTSIAGHLPGLREAMVEELGMQDTDGFLGAYEHPRK